MRKLLFIAALALLAPSIVMVQAQARPHKPNPCAHMTQVAFNHSALCTHGPDAAPTLADIAIANAAFENPAAPAPCVKTASESDYTSGKRVRVFYGWPSDTTYSATNRALIPGWLSQGADKLRASGATVGASYAGQDYRFYCTGATPSVAITDIQLVPIGADGQFTYNDLAQSLTNAGYTNSAYDYAVFVDGILAAYPYGGQGSIRTDTNPNPALNQNNNATISKVSLINAVPAWGDYPAQLFMHEVGHNLGAVQNNSPHASGGFHCYDEYDTMCYNDGGSYFGGGGTLQYLCPTDDGATSIWDCGRDDYYNVAAATVNTSGTYLERNWNLARSAWLTPIQSSGGGAPAVMPPTYVFAGGAVSGGTSTTKTIPVAIKWTASDSDGLTSTQLQMQTDLGPWVNVSVGATAKTVTKSLGIGHDFNFQVRATDLLGNVSAYAVGTPFALRAVQESSVVFTGAWNTANSSNYMGRATRYTTASNANGLYNFTARAVAWIGSKGPAFGSSSVSMDAAGSITKSQKATGDLYRTVVHKYSWPTTGAHSIRVTCQATADHPRCDVDAFAVII